MASKLFLFVVPLCSNAAASHNAWTSACTVLASNESPWTANTSVCRLISPPSTCNRARNRAVRARACREETSRWTSAAVNPSSTITSDTTLQVARHVTSAVVAVAPVQSRVDVVSSLSCSSDRGTSAASSRMTQLGVVVTTDTIAGAFSKTGMSDWIFPRASMRGWRILAEATANSRIVWIILCCCVIIVALYSEGRTSRFLRIDDEETIDG